MKTADLAGAALDWAVAKCEGPSTRRVQPAHALSGLLTYSADVPTYSTDWAQGGPIIERERITVVCAVGDYSSKLRGYKTYWVAEIGQQCAGTIYGSQGDHWGKCFQINEDCVTGPTPLVAAMRCYVASKLGDEIEIPKELL